MEDQKLRTNLAEADAGSTAINLGEGPEALYFPLRNPIPHAIDSEVTGDGTEGQKIHRTPKRRRGEGS